MASQEWIIPATLLIALVFGATLADVRAGLIAIVFSIILSPEVMVYGKPIRLEDVILGVVIISTLAILSIKASGFRSTPLNAPIAILLVWNSFCYVNAVVYGNLYPFGDFPVDPTRSFFNLLKKAEYFCIFFVVVNAIGDLRDVKIFTLLSFVTCLAAVSFSIYEFTHFTPTPSEEFFRAGAPFDRLEPNTFGQYLIFLIAMALSLLLSKLQFGIKILLGAFLAFVGSSLMFTHSRGSYMALLGMLAVMGILRNPKILIVAAMIVALALLKVLPASVNARINNGLHEIQEVAQGTARPETNSFFIRVKNFREGFQAALESPLFGKGFTFDLARIEAQIPKEAVETGFVGLAMFVYVLWVLVKMTWFVYKHHPDEFVRTLSGGFLCGFAAYMISGLTAVPLSTIRTAEPFWFFAGMIAYAYTTLKEKDTISYMELPA